MNTRCAIVGACHSDHFLFGGGYHDTASNAAKL